MQITAENAADSYARADEESRRGVKQAAAATEAKLAKKAAKKPEEGGCKESCQKEKGLTPDVSGWRSPARRAYVKACRPIQAGGGRHR